MDLAHDAGLARTSSVAIHGDEDRLLRTLSTPSAQTITRLQSFNEEYEKRVRLLEVETKQKNEEIARLASKCAETPPELVQLKQEADDMRHGHKRDLERAEARATYAEKESNTVRATHEKRVVNLESRLQVIFMVKYIIWGINPSLTSNLRRFPKHYNHILNLGTI